MKKIIKYTVLLISIPVIGFAVWFTYIGGTAYLFALRMESRWNAAKPKTKIDLEKYLYWYKEKIINPKESMWGNNYHLKPNERMVQYLILSKAPLDVVYDNNDKIMHIFTSYE